MWKAGEGVPKSLCKIRIPCIGTVSRLSRQPQLLYESKTTDSKPLNCKIISISRNGITLTTVDKHGIRIGDDIKVKFTLDNSASTEIEKKAHVKWVKDNYIGCEFFETYKHDVTLAFYFL